MGTSLYLLDILRQALSENLSHLRKTHDWDQHDLAAAAQVNVDKIRAWEQRRRFPDSSDLLELGKALGVDAWRLVTPRAEGVVESTVPPDIVDALSRCGPEEFESIRAILRGYGKFAENSSKRGNTKL